MQNVWTFFSTAFCAVTILSTAATPLNASDWAQWRGPKRDGVSTETGLLKDWPEGGPRLLWKAGELGKGYSTVAVKGERLFTMGDKSDASFVIALDVSGKQVWAAKLGRAGEFGGYEGPRAMPTVDGDLVFALNQFGELVCLSASTGQEVWRKDGIKDFGGNRPGWGYTESPLVDGDKVVFTPGGSAGAIVALDKKTGALVWRSKDFTDSPHYSSLIKEEIGGVPQYIQLTAASVAGVAAADGKLLWRTQRRGQTAVIPTPIYSDNQVYVTSGYGVGCNLFRITHENGAFSAAPVYDNKVMVNHHGGVIRLGEYIYGYSDGKGWTCQTMKSGDAVWQERSKLEKGAIAYADGRFYLRAESGQGTVVLIEATPDGYKEHGRFNQPDRSRQNSWPHPVIANGRLYLRDQEVLLCYDIKAK
jgi:outer membrane protein assembly factor BamB